MGLRPVCVKWGCDPFEGEGDRVPSGPPLDWMSLHSGLPPPIEHGKSPDTFFIFAQDPLPLRLCTFAPLRSFLPTAGISAQDPLPLRLCTFAPLRSFLPTSGVSALDLLPTEPYARFSPQANRPARNRWLDFQEP